MEELDPVSNVQALSTLRCSLEDSSGARVDLRWIMTTLQMAIPAATGALDTPQAQEARWIAWKVKGAAADRITQRRVRIAFAALLVTLGGATLAMVL